MAERAVADPRGDRALWLGLLVVAIVATVARGRALGWPADAEELALVGPFSPSEWGTNPPLLTWIYSAVARPEQVVALGRASSTLAAALAIVGVGATARAAGAGRWGAIFAAAALGVLPAFVQQAALCRAYAPAAALLAWHLHALVRAGEGSGRAARAWVVTGALLPCLHYATAPGVLIELVAVGASVPVRARRSAAGALAVVLSVLAWGVASSGSRPPVDDDPERLLGLIRLGWSGTTVEASLTPGTVVGVGIALTAVAVGLLGGSVGGRALARGALSVAAGVFLTAWVARARAPVQILWVLPCLPVLVGPVGARSPLGGALRGAVAVAGLTLLGAAPRPSRLQEATAALASLQGDEQAVALSPDPLWDMWLFEATGTVPQGPSTRWTCSGRSPGVPCIEAAGRRWYRASDGLPEAGRWLAVAIDAPAPPARCGPAAPLGQSVLWRTATCPAP